MKRGSYWKLLPRPQPSPLALEEGPLLIAGIDVQLDSVYAALHEIYADGTMRLVAYGTRILPVKK